MTRLATLVLALVLVAVPAAASDGKFDRATLKCLAGFWVLIEDFNDVARRVGFSEETFKTGNKVLTELATPGEPYLLYLYVNVNTLATGPERRVPFSINLELSQNGSSNATGSSRLR